MKPTRRTVPILLAVFIAATMIPAHVVASGDLDTYIKGNSRSQDMEENKTVAPRLANRHELDGMYRQLKELLVKISYINAENPDYWMNKLRHFGTRMKLQAKEVSMIRGICRQIDWYGKKCYEEGRKRQQNEEDL